MCTGTLEFPPKSPTQRRKERKRPLGNKLQEIACRSPQHVRAIEVMVDLILDDLDAEAHQDQQQKA